jgi:glyoxylase-like metal-dependent hydrolase (beta-lactamase superfamily II)
MAVLQKFLGHRVEQETDGLWRIVFHLPTSTNCWLLEDKGELTLVDAGCHWNTGTIFDTIKLIGKPLRRIAITHAHPDHAGAAAELARRTGATVFAHQLDIPYLTGVSNLGELEGNTISHTLHRAANHLGLLNPPGVDCPVAVQESDEIGSLKVIHTPGHTPGGASFWSEKHKALFVGDNASNRFNILSINMSVFTLARAQLIESFAKYREHDARLILPGHGRAHYSQDASADLLRSACRVQQALQFRGL